MVIASSTVRCSIKVASEHLGKIHPRTLTKQYTNTTVRFVKLAVLKYDCKFPPLLPQSITTTDSYGGPNFPLDSPTAVTTRHDTRTKINIKNTQKEKMKRHNPTQSPVTKTLTVLYTC